MSDVFGSIADGFNALAGLGFGLYDRINQAQLNEIAQQQYNEQFAFQQQQYNEGKAREDTAIQRRVADLKAAGLSPALAGGGASASANGLPVAQSDLHIGKGVPQMSLENSIRVAQMEMQKGLNSAQVNNINADTELKKAEAETEKKRPEYIEAQIASIASKINLNNAEISHLKTVDYRISSLTSAEVEKLQAEIKEIGANTSYLTQKAVTEKWNSLLRFQETDTFYEDVLSKIDSREVSNAVKKANQEIKEDKNSREWLNSFFGWLIKGVNSK